MLGGISLRVRLSPEEMGWKTLVLSPIGVTHSLVLNSVLTG